jgi:PAS domain-containing protein
MDAIQKTGAIAARQDDGGLKQVKREEPVSLFRDIADAAPVMIWMCGPDRLYTYFSRRWLEFTGRPLERELRNGWAEGIHPEDVTRVIQTHSDEFAARREFRIPASALRRAVPLGRRCRYAAL